MTPKAAVEFVETHGVVLESAAGPVPTLAHAVAGGKIRGSWWAHPQAHAIYAATLGARDSPDVLTCRVVRRKVTLVHRRLWPALVRLAPLLAPEILAAVREIHTDSGRHKVLKTPYPAWVPAGVARASRKLSREEAIEALGDWVLREMVRRPRGDRSGKLG